MLCDAVDLNADLVELCRWWGACRGGYGGHARSEALLQAVLGCLALAGGVCGRKVAPTLEGKLLEITLPSDGACSGLFWLARTPLKASQKPSWSVPSAPARDLWVQHGGGSSAASATTGTVTLARTPFGAAGALPVLSRVL